jgi:hypothetical protein
LSLTIFGTYVTGAVAVGVMSVVVGAVSVDVEAVSVDVEDVSVDVGAVSVDVEGSVDAVVDSVAVGPGSAGGSPSRKVMPSAPDASRPAPSRHAHANTYFARRSALWPFISQLPSQDHAEVDAIAPSSIPPSCGLPCTPQYKP